MGSIKTSDPIEGPNGEKVILKWFPNKRLDIIFEDCGLPFVTRLWSFPNKKKTTKMKATIQTRYGEESY